MRLTQVHKEKFVTRSVHQLLYERTQWLNLPLNHTFFFAGYVISKCGVLLMSLFVFFTTTMSVSFTLRETQARMLKFTGNVLSYNAIISIYPHDC